MIVPVLEAAGLGKTFRDGRREVVALEAVDLKVTEGECHAIVGESGSGKTTLANLILGLLAPSTGELRFRGESMPARRSLALRRRIQLVQQNPLSSLNPRRRVGASVSLPLAVHRLTPRRTRAERVARLLEEVGWDPARARRHPHALSGGQRQRVAIARALACEPELIVFDEPTSALDVLVQARVLALLDRLRRERGLTYLFITHDLAVVRAVADRVSVFSRGRLLETGTVEAIFSAPETAYTRELIGAVPVVTEEDATLRAAIRGEESDPA
jgi:ABC-type glutathione transport system ATPase component